MLGIYFVASILAFFTYLMDKSAAQNNQWRVKESTLHLLGLVGGWPGALLAQKTLRHKSKKMGFQMVFWATVMINCSVLGWLSTQDGSAFMQSIARLGG